MFIIRGMVHFMGHNQTIGHNQTMGHNQPPKSGLHSSLFFDWEPKANPLLIGMNLKVLHIRHVPDSGGSYGVDLK